MTTLHTLNVSSRENPDLVARLLRSTSRGDALLLIENGVYNLTDTAFIDATNNAGLLLHCLDIDIEARGLQRWATRAISASDSDFVALVCHHDKAVNWFA